VATCGRDLSTDNRTAETAAVDLYWLPVGAGGRPWFPLSCRVYEAMVARIERRPTCDLYHSALLVHVPEGTFVIEQATVPDLNGKERGVVAEGVISRRGARRFRIFRYEIRCWHGGQLPDIAYAVDSPRRLSNDEDRARRVLEQIEQVPAPAWGRDELATGEMWNSNSVLAWVLARSGIETATIRPPANGRAPGWQAGLVAARPGLVAAGTGPGPHRAVDPGATVVRP
jgi:hypothetical protein